MRLSASRSRNCLRRREYSFIVIYAASKSPSLVSIFDSANNMTVMRSRSLSLVMLLARLIRLNASRTSPATNSVFAIPDIMSAIATVSGRWLNISSAVL